MKRFILYLSILFFGLVGMTAGQNVNISLPDTSVTVGAQSLSIPMLVQNFNNIGAISLKINYNPSALKFKGIENEPVTGITANADTVNGVLAIGWFSMDGNTAITVGNGKLLDLVFDFTSGSSPLVFNPAQSEISDISGNTLTVTFGDGNISAPMKVSLDHVKASPGDTVNVPLRGLNLSNVGAISLKVNYNSSVLEFVGVENDNVGFTVNPSSGTITLGWFSSDNTSLEVLDGVMADLVFKYIDNSTPLEFFTFNGQTEISDLNGNVLPVTYVNGSVAKDRSMSLPNVTGQVNQDVVLPLTVKNIKVGAASLKIDFDPAVLTFKEVQNSAGDGVTANASNGVLTIGYYSAAPTFDTGTLFDIVFTYKGGESAVSFDAANSEVTDEQGSIYSGFTYNDGMVSSSKVPYFTKMLNDTTIMEGENFTYMIEAADPDGDSLTFSLQGTPPTGAAIGTKTGLFTWTPSYDQAGTYDVIFGVSDGVNLVTDTVNITVLNTNRPPVFETVLGDTSVEKGVEFQFQYTASDPDNNTLKYFLVNPPSGAVITENSGLFTWTPADTITQNIVVAVTDGFDTVTTSAQIKVFTDIIDVDNNIPNEFSLSQNYPNPFNPATLITFGIPNESKVVLKIYNLLGETVATLVNEELPAGTYKYQFDASKLTSGIYIYSISAGNYSSTKKMILMK